MMTIRYRIHSCVRDSFAAVAEIAGKSQEVTITGLLIEAVSEDGSMGHTFRVRGEPDELDRAQELAQEGGELLVSLSVLTPEGEAVPLVSAAPATVAEPDAGGGAE